MVNGPIPSDLAGAFRRLAARLRYKGISPPQASVSNTVIPITNFDQLLVQAFGSSVQADISGTVGTFVPYFTVPSGKRWTIKSYRKSQTAAVTRVTMRIAGVDIALGVDATAAAFQLLDQTLNEGDQLGYMTTGNAGDTAVFMQISYLQEDAY